MKIMENATKGDQKALGALDNIAGKFGTDNFMEIGRLITELGSRLNLAPEKCQKLSAQLEAVKTHIKYNLVHHLKGHSPCPSHCFHFLMSNPNLSSQASECPSTCGQHQQHCVECDLQHVFFNSLEALIHGGEQSGQLTSDTLKDLKALVRWRGGVLLICKAICQYACVGPFTMF